MGLTGRSAARRARRNAARAAVARENAILAEEQAMVERHNANIDARVRRARQAGADEATIAGIQGDTRTFKPAHEREGTYARSAYLQQELARAQHNAERRAREAGFRPAERGGEAGDWAAAQEWERGLAEHGGQRAGELAEELRRNQALVAQGHDFRDESLLNAQQREARLAHNKAIASKLQPGLSALKRKNGLTLDPKGKDKNPGIRIPVTSGVDVGLQV